nr:Gfo/Idh/MocA family oxidoreductase [Candidatus Soleaferrea massiliensis]
MKMALIGCGRISPNHIAAVKNNADKVTLAAVCDIDEQKALSLLQTFDLQGKVPVYTDYQSMLHKVKPELVTVATESGYHAKIGLDCLEAGCNLIIEKPIALSIRDADRLIDKAQEKGVKLCACHQNRFNRSVQKMRETLEEGRFGRMLHGAAHIRWNRGPDYYRQAAWRGTWELDGGALMNQCIHNIDLLRWMMGDEVSEVFAYTDNLNHPYIEAEDLGVALVKFRNGAYGVIEGTTSVYPQNLEETLYLFGEKGTLKVGGRSVNRIEEYRFEGIGEEQSEEVKRRYHETPPNIYGFGHTPLYADMAAAIEENRAPYVDGQAGKRALELVLAIYKSAAGGLPVKLPLADCGTTDFKGRFD